MMILNDAHLHFFFKGFPGQYGALFPNGREIKTYEAMRKVHSIERSLVVGYERDSWAKGNNAYILKLSRTRDWMAPVAFCHAQNTPKQKLLHFKRSGYYGISLYLNTSEEVEGALKWTDSQTKILNEWKALISINVPMENISRLRPFFEQLPETRILISHLGSPAPLSQKISIRETEKRLAPLLHQADLPHLGVKVSAFYAFGKYPHPFILPYFETLFSKYGKTRMFWGSDFVPALDYESFSQTIDSVLNIASMLTPAERKALLGGNLKQTIQRVSISPLHSL